jgi:hypothetical protein
MTQQQSQIFMNLLGSAAAIRIINGVGPIFGGLGLRGLATATFWTSQIQSPSEKNELKEAVKELPVIKSNDEES